MRIIRNSIIPFKGFAAINLFGVVFVRKEIQPQFNVTQRYWDIMLNHELIHTAQMKELLYIPFYLWYVFEWLIRLAIYRDTRKAYRNISFEREAYTNQYNTAYTVKRNKFAWRQYLKQRTNERY